jgi:hypothetical protein
MMHAGTVISWSLDFDHFASLNGGGWLFDGIASPVRAKLVVNVWSRESLDIDGSKQPLG